nr:anti-sigma factor [Cesiribacter sp. SM1]
MAARYPEVREELQLIEETLAGIAQAAAVTPRPGLRASILENIAAAAPDAVVPPAAAEPAAAAPVRPLQPAEPAVLPQKQYSWLMAASIGLAIMSSLAALFFWSRWQDTEQRLASMIAQNAVMVQHVSTLENRTQGMEQTLAVLTDPSYKAVPMAGLAPAPDAQAIVYWNPASAEVYLNAGSLPAAPSGKQYQLWAIVDGKPVDAGIFDATGLQLKKMRQIQNASAFAVTLEPAGGSPSPTMDQMYVMGAAS